MIDATSLGLFIAASLALLVVPGPAVTYVVTRSVQLGTRAGLAATVGLSLGGLGHVMAAVVGLSAIVGRSAAVFTTVKLLGAGYLVFLGIRTLRAPASDASDVADPPVASSSRLVGEGFVVNLLNPKAALFFLAFLPQFADAESGPVALQILLLGCVFVLLALVTDSAYAVLAGSLRRRLATSAAAIRRRRRISGVVYIGLGLTAALSGYEE